jgi:hypothetical protein
MGFIKKNDHFFLGVIEPDSRHGFEIESTVQKSPKSIKNLRLLFQIKNGFGRGGGIRTPGPREGSPVFKTGAINRSTTPLFSAGNSSVGQAKVRH